MTAVSNVMAEAAPSEHVRLFDVRKDLEAVADLVELCFADTLDADGRSYLRRMRTTAKNTALLQFTALTSEWASVPLSGYVWEQDGQIVGNASLIPYYVKGKRFYLIANVAVHPNYRRRGIARSLTLEAVKRAKERGVPYLWLHVREENAPAVDLYRSLGFTERTRRTTWQNDPEASGDEPLAGYRFITPRGRDWKKLHNWLGGGYPPEFSWHLNLVPSTLRPGIWGMFTRLFYNVYMQEWAVLDKGKLLAGAALQSRNSHANSLWLMAPQNGEESAVHALLAYVRRRASSRRAMVLDYPAHHYEEAIRGAGFYNHQTLIWMSLNLE